MVNLKPKETSFHFSVKDVVAKCIKFYRENKPVMLSSMEDELQFVEVQNPAWPLDYYKKEMAAFEACNNDLENKRQKD